MNITLAVYMIPPLISSESSEGQSDSGVTVGRGPRRRNDAQSHTLLEGSVSEASEDGQKKYKRHFSFAFYRMTAKQPCEGSTAQAQMNISTENNVITVTAQLDSGGSQNLASKELLQNIQHAFKYGKEPIYMVTVSGDTSAYVDIGELHCMDERKIP